MKLLQRQEVEVFYVIPSLRRYLAIEMKLLNFKQKDIAKLLGIEEAAISQYIKGKRGNKITFSQEIVSEIKTSAGLIKDKISLLREMQRLMRRVNETCEICKIHKSVSEVPGECEPALISCFEIRK